MSGIEGVSAEGETTVAEDSDHQEPLAADEKAADEVDGVDLGERQPRIGRRPYTPTKAGVEEHNPFHVHDRSWCHLVWQADQRRSSTADRLRTRKLWE